MRKQGVRKLSRESTENAMLDDDAVKSGGIGLLICYKYEK